MGFDVPVDPENWFYIQYALNKAQLVVLVSILFQTGIFYGFRQKNESNIKDIMLLSVSYKYFTLHSNEYDFF